MSKAEKTLIDYSKISDTDSDNVLLPKFTDFSLDEQKTGWIGWSGQEGSG